MSDWENPIPENLLNVGTVNNQFSNWLTGDLLGLSTTLKFLNTLTGTPATDAANMIDVSGAAHDGTYKGTWAAAQRVNKGFGWILNPNGTDNYITLGDSTDFSFGNGINDSAFTMAGVIEIINTAAEQVIIAKWSDLGGAENREWTIQIQPDEKLLIAIEDESANAQPNRQTDAALTTGFHTWAITYDGGGGATAANGITIYVDGALVASTASNQALYVAMENLTEPTTIGTKLNAAGVYVTFMTGDFTPPIIDKGTVWTAAMVLRFHQIMKGIYNL